MSGNYSQNAQTALIGYTTSSFGYNGSVSRRLGRYTVNVSGGGSNSVLNLPGYGNSAEFFSAGITGKLFGVNASYTKSSGNSLLGATGLVPTPLPPVIIPTDLVFYGGHAYGVGLRIQSGSTAHDDRQLFTVVQQYAQRNHRIGEHQREPQRAHQYHFRQLDMQAGYSKFVQGFSASGLPPDMVGSYYFGISRWFNFF